MKQLQVFLACMLFTCSITAQNLVPNPSFEEYFNCPSSPGQIPYTLFPFPSAPTVKDWFSPIVNSPDYFNRCTNNHWIDVPNNYYGTYPARKGNAYVGIVFFSGSSIGSPTSNNEYVECKLTSPLVAGETYTVSCYVKIMLAHETTTTGIYAADRISFAFSDTFLSSYTSPLTVNATPMYTSNKSLISDSTVWARVSNAYVAKGGEQYLTLGYFPGASPTTFTQIYPEPNNPIVSANSYYGIDDVSVESRPPCDTIKYTYNAEVCSPDELPKVLTSTMATNNFSYLWSTNDTTSSISTNFTGTYWCIATRDCDIITDTFKVLPIQDTVLNKEHISRCKVDSIRLNAQEGALLYNWSTGDTAQNIIISEPGRYTCASIKDCKVYIDDYTVEQKKDGLITTPLIDTLLCNEAEYVLGKEYDDATISYLWNTGDTTCCIEPKSSGQYMVTIKTECGTQNDTADIRFENCDNCLFVPDVFSPNGDGLNDTYGVRASCTINKFHLRIYNRWGQVVFESQDINARWNGLIRADFAEQSTYFYYIEYTTLKDVNTQILKGDITLVR